MRPDRLQCLDDTYNAVQAVVQNSQVLRKVLGPEASTPYLAVYGSTVNSLATQTDSDLDLTLLVDGVSVNHETILRVL